MQAEDTVKQTKEDQRNRTGAKFHIGTKDKLMIQHILLPRLLWPLSIYNIPATKF